MEYPQYDPRITDAPLSDEEFAALDEMLAACSDDAMNIEVMDGYVTAMLVGPRLADRLPTKDWLPAIWGGDGEGTAPFKSNRQRKKATVLVLRRLHSIDCLLRDSPDKWEPIFSVADVDGREVVDAEDWCTGFLEAVALDPDAWQPCFDSPELAPVLRPIVLLGAAEAELAAAELESLGDAEVLDATSRAVAEAVLALAAEPRIASPNE